MKSKAAILGALLLVSAAWCSVPAKKRAFCAAKTQSCCTAAPELARIAVAPVFLAAAPRVFVAAVLFVTPQPVFPLDLAAPLIISRAASGLSPPA